RAGRGDINKGPVNVLDIVQGVVELVEPLAAQRSIRRVIDPAVPLIADADRRRLWQVLLNLVGNALKYGREGGSVRVGIVPITGSRIRIEVEDDGAGLSPRAIDRLFRPFERLGAERSGIEGSGLGLALSHALVTAMGGVLTVASRYGVGSVFAIVLDAVDMRFEDPDSDDDGFGDHLGGHGYRGTSYGRAGYGEASHGRAGYGDTAYGDAAYGDAGNGRARPTGTGEGGAHGGRHARVSVGGAAGGVGRRAAPGGLRVVHVSGDPAVRAAVADMLTESLAADPVTVPRAALAVDAVRRARPAFILLDRDLPDASAPELLAQLAADPTTAATPAFVLTEDTDPRERTMLRRAGAVDILALPLDPASLVAAATALTAAMTAPR
ncbi:hybrid sensor histidine kinase/response regulator, partial [Frankia sp. CpI1-P]